MLYPVFKYGLFVWVCHLLFRPRIEGRENIPKTGPAILVSNHISAGDTYLLPAMIRRRLTFPAKLELFHGRGLKGRVLAWFLRNVGQVPMDRSGGRASASSMDSVVKVLRRRRAAGHLSRRDSVSGRPPLQGQDRSGPAGDFVRCAGHPGGHDRHPAGAVQDSARFRR